MCRTFGARTCSVPSQPSQSWVGCITHMSESRFWLSTAGKGGDFRFQPCPSREMSGVLAAAQSETPPSTLHYHNPDRVVTPDEVFGKDSLNRSLRITFKGTTVRIKGSAGTTIGKANAMKSLSSIGMTFILRIRS